MFPSIALPASGLRQNLREIFDKICADRTPLLITRKGKEDIVIMPADEFRGWEETIYLLRSPENAKNLFESIAQAKEGKTFEKQLIEL